MKNFSSKIPLITLLATIAIILVTTLSGPAYSDLNFKKFGTFPVVMNGRIKPLDTLARSSLLVIHGKQTLRSENNRSMPAIAWLSEVFFNASSADKRKIFLIHNRDIKGLLGIVDEKQKDFAFEDLTPFLQTIQEQAQQANRIPSQGRSLFQRDIIKLNNDLLLYYQLKNSIQVEDTEDYPLELRLYEKTVRGEKLPIAHPGAGSSNMDLIQKLDLAGQFRERYTFLAQAPLYSIPPSANALDRAQWTRIGENLLEATKGSPIHPVTDFYANLSGAYVRSDAAKFNTTLENYTSWLSQNASQEIHKSSMEAWFNRFSPFTLCMVLYILVFLLACTSWAAMPQILNRTAYYLLLLGLAIHTLGIFFRMYLEGRPPVTNLYSSAIFIGWAAVLLGAILEKIHRNGIGNAIASAIGFASLIIAHHLSFGGDTMEMMRAVLDSNFWLATHVVVVTLGYAATFVAGFLAIIYIIRGIFTSSLSQETAKSLGQMVYGIVCFATLFSFVGTVLGGIWADQSWGRFWGWDPKENGALLIVIWNAILLHARWGGMVKTRGLMVLAVFGNIVTSWSWFGTNMLGIGLHSYGFMEAAFLWLMGFVLSQVLIMVLGSLHYAHWKSKLSD